MDLGGNIEKRNVMDLIREFRLYFMQIRENKLRKMDEALS